MLWMEEKMKYEFAVPGEIVGKERPRVNMYTGRVYTPNKTKDYEFLVQQYFKINRKEQVNHEKEIFSNGFGGDVGDEYFRQ